MIPDQYLQKIYEKAKPIESTFLIDCKWDKANIDSDKTHIQQFLVKFSSFYPTEFKIGCTTFNIQEFLHEAKRRGYYGEYQDTNDYKNTESFPKWKISIDDFEKIVHWIQELSEKKWYRPIRIL